MSSGGWNAYASDRPKSASNTGSGAGRPSSSNWTAEQQLQQQQQGGTALTYGSLKNRFLSGSGKNGAAQGGGQVGSAQGGSANGGSSKGSGRLFSLAR